MDDFMKGQLVRERQHQLLHEARRERLARIAAAVNRESDAGHAPGRVPLQLRAVAHRIAVALVGAIGAALAAAGLVRAAH